MIVTGSVPATTQRSGPSASPAIEGPPAPPFRLASNQLAPYAPGEFWGGGNPVEACNPCNFNQVAKAPGGQSVQPGQSVDPFVGNFAFTHSVFSIPTIGGDLGINLTYNSELAQVQYAEFNQGLTGPGPTGFGWELGGLPSFITQPVGGNTQTTVTQENGAQVNFDQVPLNNACPSATLDGTRHTAPNSTATYCAAGRVDAQFGQTTSGYEFYGHGGRQISLFNNGGGVTSEGNAQNPTAIRYLFNVTPGTGGCPVKVGVSSCTTMTDTAQRITAIGYGTPDIAGVQDPLGRYYSFGYTLLNITQVQYELTSITDPLSHTWTFGYTGGGGSSNYQFDMTSVTNPDNATRSMAYNLVGEVASTTDATSPAHTTTYQYTNPCGPTTCSGVPLTQHTLVTYPTGEIDVDNYYAGLLISDSFGAGNNPSSGYFDSVSYDYNLPTTAEGNTTVGVVHPGANTKALTTVVTTDAVGDVLSVQDPNGNTTTNLYNGSLFDEPCVSAPPGVSPGSTCPTSPASPVAGATNYFWDSTGEMTAVVDPLGNTTNYGYYSNGLLCDVAQPTVTGTVSCTSPPTGSTFYTYDTYAYGSYGNLASRVTAYGTSSQTTASATYDADNEMLTSLPGDGNVGGPNTAYQTTYTYDGTNGVGRLMSMTAPLSRTTSYTYDALGNVLTATDPAGVTTATYDADARTCWSLRGTSNATCGSAPTGSTSYQYLYDTTAATQVTDQNGNSTTYTYANLAFPTLPTKVLDAAGTAPIYTAYDLNGNACLTGPVNIYSGSGAPACAWQSQETYNVYDVFGNVTSSEDPNGNTTTYDHRDAAYPNLVTLRTDPLGHNTSYVYDADGRRTVTQDAVGNFVTTGYDKNGRVCWQAPSALFLPLLGNGNCASPTGRGVTTFGYYATNQRSQMVDNAGTPAQATSSYSYDASGNLLSTTDGNAKTVSYQYNVANDVTCIAYPVLSGANCTNAPSSTNTVVDRSPDSAGRLHTTSDWLGNTITYGYDAANDVTSITYPSSTTESLAYGYDNAHNLTSAAYTGNAVGSQTDTWTPNADELVHTTSQIRSFSSTDTYDGLNRIATANGPLASDTYGYAPNGELTSDNPGGSATTFGYNQADELTSVTNGNGYGIPPTSTYAYTADGQRCWSVSGTISNPSCASPPTGATSYAWNAYGQLCWSGPSVSTSPCNSPPGGVTSYTYNGDGLRMTTSGASTATFTWNTVDARNGPQIVDDGSRAYVYGPAMFGGNAPVEQIDLSNNQASFVTSTPSGVQLVFNQSGQSLDREYYSTYGLPNHSNGAASPFGFEGGYTDPSGLIYLTSRYYEPATAQFISVDPRVSGSGQPYAFAADDPINASDPLGQWPCASGGTCGTTQWFQNNPPAPEPPSPYIASEGPIATPSGLGLQFQTKPIFVPGAPLNRTYQLSGVITGSDQSPYLTFSPGEGTFELNSGNVDASFSAKGISGLGIEAPGATGIHLTTNGLQLSIKSTAAIGSVHITTTFTMTTFPSSTPPPAGAVAAVAAGVGAAAGAGQAAIVVIIERTPCVLAGEFAPLCFVYGFAG